ESVNFNGRALSGGANLFAYVRSNPILGRDPSGLFELLEQLDVWSFQAYLRLSEAAARNSSAMMFAGGVVAALNMYALALSPENLDAFLAQPNALSLLVADMELAASAGGAIVGVIRNPQVLSRFVPEAGFRLFSEAEEWLARNFGGESQ